MHQCFPARAAHRSTRQPCSTVPGAGSVDRAAAQHPMESGVGCAAVSPIRSPAPTGQLPQSAQNLDHGQASGSAQHQYTRHTAQARPNATRFATPAATSARRRAAATVTRGKYGSLAHQSSGSGVSERRARLIATPPRPSNSSTPPISVWR